MLTGSRISDVDVGFQDDGTWYILHHDVSMDLRDLLEYSEVCIRSRIFDVALDLIVYLSQSNFRGNSLPVVLSSSCDTDNILKRDNVGRLYPFNDDFVWNNMLLVRRRPPGTTSTDGRAKACCRDNTHVLL